MTWTTPSRVRNTITKIAVAAAFVAIPAAAVNIPAYATPGFASTPSVLSAPPPALRQFAVTPSCVGQSATRSGTYSPALFSVSPDPGRPLLLQAN